MKKEQAYHVASRNVLVVFQKRTDVCTEYFTDVFAEKCLEPIEHIKNAHRRRSAVIFQIC